MNAIAERTASTAVGALQSLKKGIANVQQTMVRKNSSPFLRMLQDGHWVYGQEDIEVETGSIWAANPLSIEHGWTAWNREKGADNSGGPLGEVMVPQSAPLPPKDTLKDVGADWEYQTAITFRCLNGTDKDEQVMYKASSVGASKAMDVLVKAIMRQLDEDENSPVPLVSFDSSTYNHKTFGRTYEPVFNIVDWAPLDGEQPVVADPEPKAAAPAKAAAAKPRTRTVPATTAKAAVDEDDELAKMEAEIARRKAAKDAAAKADDATRPLSAAELDAIAKAKRKAELLAQMQELEADDAPAAEQAAAQAEAPASDQPMQRRRRA